MGLFGNTPMEHVALGRVALDAGNHKKAASHLEKAVAKLPYYGEAHLLLWQSKIAAFQADSAEYFNDPEGVDELAVIIFRDPLEDLRDDVHRLRAQQLGDEGVQLRVAALDAQLETLWNILMSAS